MFNGLKVDLKPYREPIEAFKSLNIIEYLNNDSSVNWDDLSRAIGGCDERLLSYFQTLDNGNGTIRNQAASVNGLRAHLEQTGQMYTFAAVKAALFNTALNAGVMLLFSAAIQAVVKGIDNYIHANENAIKLADELKDKHASAAKELESHRKTADELADSYDRLSKGVKKKTTSMSMNPCPKRTTKPSWISPTGWRRRFPRFRADWMRKAMRSFPSDRTEKPPRKIWLSF